MRRKHISGAIAAIAAALALFGATACSTSKDGAAPAKSPTTTTKPGVPTVWQQTLGQVKPDGTVDVSSALTAFAMAIAPVPGVTVPAGPRGDIASGTIAVRWVFAHWADRRRT